MNFDKIDEGTQFKIYDRTISRLQEINGVPKPMEMLMEIIDNETRIAISETDTPEYEEMI